uniref:Glycosyltransferase RgtA/B/C/D-like domain-containing protein n=1 Tax=Eiseniibacteriota bacterium TaxID=2212470 RepID=A0A832MKW0_UNCEI
MSSRPVPRRAASALWDATRPGIAPPPAAPSRLFDLRGPYLGPLLLLILTRAVADWTLPQAAEDAYITFRYARSLATGEGLVYNPGERVMGFTSPLWTAWNALGIVLFRDPLPWARGWAAAADAVTLVAVARMLERHVSRAAAWAFTIPFATWPYFSALAASGMENGVMIALAAVAAGAATSRAVWAGPALGALALSRPEGAVMAAVIGAWAGARDRIVGAILAGAVWGGLALYYGSPIPQSLRSKAVLYGTPGPIEGRFWWEWLLPFAPGRWSPVLDFNAIFPLAIVLAPAVVFGAAAVWRARRSALAAFLAAGLAAWGGYAALGVAYFWWYAAVPLTVALALGAAGFECIARGRALGVAATLFLLGAWTWSPPIYLGRARTEFETFGATARFLREAARPGERVLLEPIGWVGWQAPLVVIDEVGLVSRGVAERRARGPGWYADLLAERAPEWLVVRRGVLDTGRAFAGAGAPFRSAAERDAALARYRLVRDPGPAGDPSALLVLRRAD